MLFIILIWTVNTVYAGDRLPSLLVSHSWQLNTTSKGKPEVLNIKEFQSTFSHDGKWVFKSVMSGQFEGMKMNGAGTWRIKDSKLFYTVGGNSGQSNIEIKNGILKLNPDPVLLFNGETPINTVYVKH